VIFVSAYGDTTKKIEGFKAGGVDFITKPFDRDEVLVRIENQLQLWKLTERLEQEVNRRTAELTLANQKLRQGIAERRKVEDKLSWEVEVNRTAAELSRNLLSPVSRDDISFMILEHAKGLTGSVYGFVGYIDPNTGHLVCPTLTRDIWDTCRVADKAIVFKEFTGLWGWVLKNRKSLLVNAPAEDPRSSGTPQGHVPIHRFLSAPALIGGTLVGQVSVANAGHDYTDCELEAIERLANLYAIAIQRQQSEEDLKQYRNLLEERVKDRTVELEAANRELEAFGYSVSHDLRAPLRHIDGFLELLQTTIGIPLNKQSLRYMDMIHNAVQKMGQLIDDLLAFSRMGRQEILLQQADLGKIVHNIIRELEPDIAGRLIEWRVGDLPVIRCDVSMLRIVLSNLISNAIKFTRPRQQAKIEIGSVPGQPSEIITFVRDNGVGFDMDYADQLFGVFQRQHHANKFEGTGIGLANVRRIINRHGGRTWAEGSVDQGATFFFSLPHTSKGEGGVKP
jgi:signal transduction histidine kinase